MHFLSARAARTAVIVIALSAGGLWALRAMDAKADPQAVDDSSPCAEGRALFAAKLAYLEARIAPEPSQEDAWRRFADAMRASAVDVDHACAEDTPHSFSADAIERLKRMQKHAAAIQAMLGAMANAYEAIAPTLTVAQRDILARNIVPPPPPPPPGREFGPRGGDMTMTCGEGSRRGHERSPPWGWPPL